MGIPKYELNRRPLQVAADQEFDPNSTNAQSGAAVAQAMAALAPAYNSANAYYPGDLVMRNGKIWRALHVIASGTSWAAADWDEVDLNDLLKTSSVLGMAIPEPGTYSESSFLSIAGISAEDFMAFFNDTYKWVEKRHTNSIGNGGGGSNNGGDVPGVPTPMPPEPIGYGTIRYPIIATNNASSQYFSITIIGPDYTWTIEKQSVDAQPQYTVSRQSSEISLAENVTYSALVALRNGGNLVPGKWYRITDYRCSTQQARTMAEGNAYDILVRADDESHLNENAFAAHHEGDTYFQNCKLENWLLKYCLDNDTDRFAWAKNIHNSSVTIESDLICNRDILSDGSNQSLHPYCWKNSDEQREFKVYTDSKLPDIGDNYYNSTSATSPSGNLTDVNVSGKGVVYYMKDEWGNECPYDFKNIKFQRWAVTACPDCPSLVVDNADNNYRYYYGAKDLQDNNVLSKATYGDDTDYFYTFALKDIESDEWFDYTVVAHLGLKNDEGNEIACYDNHLTEATDEYASGKGEMVKMLNNIVFFNCYTDLSDTSYADDYSYCNNNRFLGNCHSNTFGNDCRYNSFGNNCGNNSFGNKCYGNSFGNDCYSNSFGNGFQYNSFGNNNYQNTFGNYCQNNSFGNSCYRNSFGNDCYSNSFGNGFQYNSFGNYCIYNSFGNYCNHNSFGNSFASNSFGNDCGNNSFGNYCQTITVFDGVMYCSVTGGSQSAPVKNAQILNGTAGTSQNKLTINFAANKSYTQIAAKNTPGNLVIFNPADMV